MKTILITILLLISTNLVFADSTPYYVITQPPDVPVQSTTTTFSVEIPNEDVNLVTVALCNSTGKPSDMTNCGADVAKKVVIQFINDQVASYKKAQVDSIPIAIQ